MMIHLHGDVGGKGAAVTEEQYLWVSTRGQHTLGSVGGHASIHM